MYTSFGDTLEKVVRLLKSSKSSYISGEEISSSLGLSRAAIWKSMNTLKSLGYKIKSKQRSGYRLISKTDLLLPWEILDGLQTETLGRKIYYFDTIESTQSFALKVAAKPYENGSVIIAARQTHGRGRQDRKWISPRGGIWLSILLRPNFELSQVALFPMLTSLALAVAIEKTLNLRPKLKWPNDVMINNKKVAGVLVDASIESNKIDYLVIGIGINFRIKPHNISKKIKNSTNFSGVSTLVGKRSKASPTTLVQAFLSELEQLYIMTVANKLQGVRKEWRRRSSTIGKNVKISTPSGVVTGKAIGMDEDGALLVSSGGKTQRLLVGDIRTQK